MMDEAIGNLTCTLNTYGYNENTYLIITSDNGGDPSAIGSSYPYKGDQSFLPFLHIPQL
jgi:arylsulfatase I/J